MKILYGIKIYHITNDKCVQKITRYSSLTNLEYKPRGLMAENNNVCKTIRRKHMLSITI